jgi:hypothetical protein
MKIGQCPVPLLSLFVEAVKARINDTTPSVVVIPRDPSPDAVGQAAQVDFLSLREVTPAGDLVWAAHLQDGTPPPSPTHPLGGRR